MISLVDGDVVVYSAAFAAESRFYAVRLEDETIFTARYKRDINEFVEHVGLTEEDGMTISKESVGNGVNLARYNLQRMMGNILAGTGTEDYEIYLTGEGNFREEVAVTKKYKGNRKQPRPIYYQEVRDMLITDFNAVVVDGMEADDMLAIRLMEEGDNAVLCSPDKDLNMVPGWHYNWDKGKLYEVSERDAMDSFYIQLVEGDSTDNIPGMYHFTGKRATQAVKEDILVRGPEAILEIYKDHMTELEEIGKLLWMKRTHDDNWTVERLHDQ